eukprot:scaffold2234_cov151-Cylindrotheca_fusiformis.AAC.4
MYNSLPTYSLVRKIQSCLRNLFFETLATSRCHHSGPSSNTMANYQIAYPALPPLASGITDSPAAAIAAGAPLNDEHMAAATLQVKNRRMLHEIHLATDPEVQAAVKRELCVHAENAAGAVAAPLWAQALENQLNETLQNQMNETLQALQNQINDGALTTQNQINALQNKMDDIQRMLRNAGSSAPNHPIFPVRNADGILPADAAHSFPNDRSALDSLTAPELKIFLDFYDLDTEPENTGLERLMLYLGIRP